MVSGIDDPVAFEQTGSELLMPCSTRFRRALMMAGAGQKKREPKPPLTTKTNQKPNVMKLF